MRLAYDVATVRSAEESLMARLPSGTLMQRAATALARRCAAVLGHTYGARVVLLVGKGDNGGDALFAGALLALRGARVDAVLVSGSAHDRGLSALRRAGGRVGTLGDLSDADLVVDGMLGIGGRGGLRDVAAEAATAAAQAAVPLVAVDIPSGVDADSGEVSGAAVSADVTVTFGALKAGLVVSPGAEHAGLVEVVDIGLELADRPASLEVLDAVEVRRRLPRSRPHDDKYRRGVVGLLAGSTTYPGAAVLAAGGAVVAGAGMVRHVGPESVNAAVRAAWPEVVASSGEPTAAGQVQAWVVGPGLGLDQVARGRLASVLATDLPVVLDADALTVLAKEPGLLHRAAPTVITPHAGEFARLTGVQRDDVEAARLRHLRPAATALQSVVLLKGMTTLVATAEGRVRANPTGTPRLAAAGSGDVLAGAIGALLAQGLDAYDAASVAAFLHGLAGHFAARPGAGGLAAAWADAVGAVEAS